MLNYASYSTDVFMMNQGWGNREKDQSWSHNFCFCSLTNCSKQLIWKKCHLLNTSSWEGLSWQTWQTWHKCLCVFGLQLWNLAVLLILLIIFALSCDGVHFCSWWNWIHANFLSAWNIFRLGIYASIILDKNKSLSQNSLLVNGLNPGVSVVCLVWSSGWE